MLATPVQIADVRALRHFVHQAICDQNQLEMEAFQMTERMLTRRGQPCGILYCVHGPRSVKLTAVWETDRNTVLFYGSRGERQQQVPLAGPALRLHRATPQREPVAA